jgi:DNA ligase-1
MKNKDFQNLPQQISPKVGIPIKPMLSKSIKGIGEVLERFNGINFTCEYKYDGMRGQIHFNRAGSEIKLYSRNLEKMTMQFPELPEQIIPAINDDVENFILDTEIVAFEPSTNKFLPFQSLQ